VETEESPRVEFWFYDPLYTILFSWKNMYDLMYARRNEVHNVLVHFFPLLCSFEGV
jgi:hypothetical protein